MKTVGVTGGIGAGKSLVCRIFATLGIPVYDADSRARRLMEEDRELVGSIKAAFGAEAYSTEGALNRPWLAERVFREEAETARLNALVHPRVGLDFSRWMKAQKDVPYVIKEAALLFEAGSYKELDAVVLVQAPEELRIRRTLLRDEQRSKAQVRAIMERQWPESEKLRLATHSVKNDERSLLIPQVLRLHQRFTDKS